MGLRSLRSLRISTTHEVVYLGDLELISLKLKHFNDLQLKPAKTLLYSPSMLELREHIIDDIDREKNRSWENRMKEQGVQERMERRV